MDLLRHHRSLALLIFVLATYFSLSAAEHPHRHHHNGNRHQRQSDSPKYYHYENFDPVEYGDWGPWTSAGECSRSCGGGVAYDVRTCYSTRTDGSPACRGSAKRYYSCNVQDCSDPYFDFRAHQCSMFDEVPFDKFYYKWIPYTKAPNKCELNCMPQNERFYYRHKKQVIDGTRCDDEKLDICVNGRCLPVGCDHLLGSPAREDKCRVCEGDSSTCNTLRGVLDRDDLQVGYNDLLLIPVGAVNIHIREVQPSNNYLAIRNLTGHYYLNGNWRIDFPKSNRFAGTIFHYERRSLGLASPESITALGPIKESIYIVILYQERNRGIEYEYSVPKNIQSTDPDGYRWMYGDFSNCSATCGGGYRSRRVWCAKRKDDTPVSDDLCDPALEPIQNQTCAAEPCPPQWIMGEWSECSHSCGFNGTQTRTVHCEQIISNGKPTEVENYRCTANGEETPPTNQSCNVGLPCPKWFVGPWKACDKLCGDGFHRREVRCYYKIDGRISVTKDSNCPEAKPEFQKPCFLRPCEGVDWIISEWSGCSDKCDVTTETKRALCSTKNGKVYPDQFCRKSKLPTLVRDCKAPACEYLWYANQWSECSSKCGSGIQTRKVFCGTNINDTIKKVDDKKCDPKKKYETSQNCTGTGVCKGDWYAGPWSACSKNCSGGTMNRKVFCFVENKTVHIDNCDSGSIIFTNEECNNQPCGEDGFLPYSSKQTIVEEGTEYECENEEDSVVQIPVDVPLSKHLNKSVIVTTTEPMAETETTTDGTEPPTMVPDESSPESSTEAKKDRRKRDIDGSPTSDPSTNTTDASTTDLTTDNSTMDSTTDASTTDLTTDNSTTDASTMDSTTDTSTTNNSTTDSLMTEGSSLSTELPPNVTDSLMVPDMVALKAEDPSFSSNGTETTLISTEPTDTTGSINSSETTDTASMSSEISSSSESSSSLTSESSSSSESSSGLTSESTSEESSSSSGSLETSSESTETTGSTESSSMSSESSSTGPGTDTSTDSSSENSSSGLDTSSVDYSTWTSEPYGSSSSANPITSFIDIETTTKMCLKKVLKCEVSQFGCCVDGKTSATGPFGAGCPEISTCQETKFGCCPDGVTPAESAKPKNCPQILCNETLFGCCADGVSTAVGNDYEGCPIETTTLEYSCKDSEFGCCPDGISAASGPAFSGCFECIDGSGDCSSACNESLYGCCPDGFTPAIGPNFTGCAEETSTSLTTETEWTWTDSNTSTTEQWSTTVISCADLAFGCCEDNETAASGPNGEGCNQTAVNCTDSKFGCCEDGVTSASGENQEGCKPPCQSEPFGCCYDNKTAAHGPNKEGCCLNSLFGCCPDNVVAATGPNLEGCSCQYSPYGCCPDNTTSARGPKNQGCGCEYSEFGCCPNRIVEAKGPNYEGCPCYTYQFGCCPDGVSRPTGPSLYGCSCNFTEFGCCSDGKTPATNADRICTCEASKYGCCPDGVSEAQGEDFQGCSTAITKPGDVCSLPQDHGPCREFTVKWFFDTQYGSCSRFWYGGCEGNGNRFKTQDECKNVCVEPVGKDACFLPKISGPCEGYYHSWYYDAKYKQCRPFVYGGCLGNNNKFQTAQECEQLCGQPDHLEPCEQPVQEGPCKGNFSRWYFDKKEGSCKTFNYGGCKGNNNNFLTEVACQQQCLRPGKAREHCFLPKAAGNGTEKYPRWFFDQSENRCVPFYYSGSDGNLNNFPTQDVCDRFCPPRVAQQVCTHPAVPGDCYNYTERWYFNILANECRQFYYGGCGGNENNFVTESECRYRCVSGSERPTASPTPRTPPTTPITSQQPGPVVPLQPVITQADVCRLIVDPGPCEQKTPSWYYDSRSGKCKEFLYSGCGGNQNRFENEDHCTRYCSFLRLNETVLPIPSPDLCEAARRDCENLKSCPYGVEKSVDSYNCERCSCYNPCRLHECPANEQCGFDVYRNSEGNVEYRPICRPVQKPGGCPYLTDSRQCGVSCRTDADCPGDDKCCAHNCGNACVPPTSVGAITRVPTEVTDISVAEPSTLRPSEVAGYPPQIQDAEIYVESEEGNYATLRCVAIGTPKPVVTWRKGGTIIDRSVARYKLTDGILQVVNLHKSDSGIYICTADNGIGAAAVKEFTLAVKDGVERSAEILYETFPSIVVTLGAQTTLHCYAYGYPNPTVTWWKEANMVNRSDIYQFGPDKSLIIKQVVIRSLGPYTCQAYNGLGRAASWTLTLQAVGPAQPLSPEDEPYRTYLMQPPEPEVTTLMPPTTSVSTLLTTTRKEFTAEVQTSIQTNDTTYSPGSEISIPCDVAGYPTPQVVWLKDKIPIASDDRISISETFRLQIRDANINDSGEYTCSAENKYSSSSSLITISVEGVYVHPNCTDNLFFANCKLIVQGKFCKHQYYAKFCCRSCTLDGQLPAFGDHLNFAGSDSNSSPDSPQFKRHARHARDLVKFLSRKQT